MSEPLTPAAPAIAAPTPSVPDASATPAPAAAKPSRADFVKNLNAKLGLSGASVPPAHVLSDKLNALARGETPSETPAPAETAPETGNEEQETPAETTETAAETPAEETGNVETPPEPAKEEPKTYAHQLAKLQLEAQRNKSDALKHKDLATKSSARVAELEAQLASIAKDPLAALKHAGSDPVKFAEMLLDPNFKLEPEKPKFEVPPEVQELIDAGKKAKEEAARKAEQDQETAVRTEHTQLIQSHMDIPEFKEKFPLVAAMPDGAAKLLAWIEMETEQTGKEPDLATVARVTNAAIAKDLAIYLKNDQARKALFADPELADVLKAFGATPAAPAPAAPAPAAGKKTAAPAAPPPAAEEPPVRFESPLNKEARARAKTLTSKVTGSVPSRTTKTSSSAELAARLNQQFVKQS